MPQARQGSPTSWRPWWRCADGTSSGPRSTASTGRGRSVTGVSGENTFHNPQTGEVHTVRAGEALHFRAGTWHYGYNFGREDVRILVAFAPLPPDITAAAEISALATPLEGVRGGRYEYLGGHPWNAAESRASEKIRVLRESDWLELIHGTRQPVRVEVFASTENVTMGKIELPPGVVTDRATHPGDLTGVVTDGWAGITWEDRPEWLEMQTLDGCMVPEGVSYRLMNMSDRPATFVFGAAPGYR